MSGRVRVADSTKVLSTFSDPKVLSTFSDLVFNRLAVMPGRLQSSARRVLMSSETARPSFTTRGEKSFRPSKAASPASPPANARPHVRKLLPAQASPVKTHPRHRLRGMNKTFGPSNATFVGPNAEFRPRNVPFVEMNGSSGPRNSRFGPRRFRSARRTPGSARATPGSARQTNRSARGTFRSAREIARATPQRPPAVRPRRRLLKIKKRARSFARQYPGHERGELLQSHELQPPRGQTARNVIPRGVGRIVVSRRRRRT
jgi:hypothetical protein